MPTSSKADAPADPNKLVRSRAGVYRTSDDRFEVRQAALGWFLIDSTVTDELGQELTRGPFPTLAAVGDEIPEARRTTIKSLPRPRTAAKPAKPKAEAAPPPQTWIDKLPAREAADVRRLIRGLEVDGIADAESLVRAARRSDDPLVATRILEQRLAVLVDELPAGERAAATRVVQRVAELLSSGGTNLFNPLPGWALVEVEAGAKPPDRRIVVRGTGKKR
ncbi:MAG TPA: hypothetical protein VFH90_05395 [Candidatus Limnocylindria bacterium]|nr:hypothetical protein [Candidatus Limnocylindria bacterium]